MKKQIGTITIGILMLASVMAMTMYGGESYSFKTNLTNPVYTVINNSYNLTGMNVTFNDDNITIFIAPNYKPDNFTLIFFDNITNEIVKTITNTIYTGGGGGGSSTRYVDRNVTVFEPTYIDRNVTTEKEVEVETIIYKDSEYSPWKLMLIAIFGLAAGWIVGDWFIYKKKKVNKIEEEDYVSGDKKDL